MGLHRVLGTAAYSIVDLLPAVLKVSKAALPAGKQLSLHVALWVTVGVAAYFYTMTGWIWPLVVHATGSKLEASHPTAVSIAAALLSGLAKAAEGLLVMELAPRLVAWLPAAVLSAAGMLCWSLAAVYGPVFLWILLDIVLIMQTAGKWASAVDDAPKRPTVPRAIHRVSALRMVQCPAQRACCACHTAATACGQLLRPAAPCSTVNELCIAVFAHGALATEGACMG